MLAGCKDRASSAKFLLAQLFNSEGFLFLTELAVDATGRPKDIC
jgi:hypothetical protein